MAEHAALIEKHINQLANDPFAPPLDLRQSSPEGIDILSGNDIVLTITERDAAASTRFAGDLPALSAEVVRVLTEEITRTRELNSPRARLFRIGETILFIIFFIIVFIVINRIYHRLVKRIDEMPTEGDPVEQGETTEVFHSVTWKNTVKLTLNILRIVLLLLILIIIVPLALQLFPITARIARQAIELLLTPVELFWNWLVAYQKNFMTIAVIIFIAYIIIRLVQVFFSEIKKGDIRFNSFDPEWATFTSRMVTFLIVIGTFVVAFPYLPGSDSAAFRGISVFLGLLFTLSSTAAVTNIVAGIIQTYTGAFRVGDLIKIGGVTGFVIEKRLLTTRLRTFKNEEVSIPNGSVLNNNVLNYTTLAEERGLVLHTTVSLSYDVSWRQAQDLLVDAALATPNVLPDPRPFILMLQTSLHDYYVAYQLNCYTKEAQLMGRTYTALHKNILDKFNEANVEIMSPTFAALRDGNTAEIPSDYLPDDYLAPSFRVDDTDPKATHQADTKITLD